MGKEAVDSISYKYSSYAKYNMNHHNTTEVDLLSCFQEKKKEETFSRNDIDIRLEI